MSPFCISQQDNKQFWLREEKPSFSPLTPQIGGNGGRFLLHSGVVTKLPNPNAYYLLDQYTFLLSVTDLNL